MYSAFVWFFLSFRGRATRQEFWLGYLGLITVVLLLNHSLSEVSLAFFRPASGPWYRDDLDLALALPSLLLMSVALWPLAAVCAKRLHDAGFPAWLLFAVPVLSVAAKGMLGAPYVPFWFLLFIVGALPGTRGDNRYGVDPLAHEQV